VAGLQFKLQEGHDTPEVQRKSGEPGLIAARTLLAQVLTRLTTLPDAQATALLERLQQSLFQDFATKWSLLQSNLNPPGPITLADVPAQLRTRFVSADGQQFLLQIYPRQNIWDGEPLREFVSQLRQVDADVTGNPVIGYESIRAIKEGYVKGGLCAAAVVLVTFLTLRRGGDTLRALLPVGCGLLWTGGLMWLFSLPFNLANLVVIPLIIGVGVDGGINFIRRVREEARPGWKLIGESTGQAIALYSLDSMAGFSSLLVARHYGIFSMGLLLTLAVGTVLLASLTVLPLLLTTPFVEGNGIEQKVKENKPQLVSLPTL
jgi:predicted RND superfamily exporter protein